MALCFSKGVNMDSVFRSTSEKNSFTILSGVRVSIDLSKILFKGQLKKSERDNIFPNLKAKELKNKVQHINFLSSLLI